MATVLIKNGRIVTAVDDYQADILIEDGRIRTIGQGLVVGNHVETHDASGLLVLPGGVDVHTHLDWDFGVARTVDTFGTGTQGGRFWWDHDGHRLLQPNPRRQPTGRPGGLA